MIEISNKHLSVAISPIGAEVQSIKDVNTQREYLWHGDERWWSGHSPILFPIVGGLWNGTCRADGQELHISKHGFVRRAPWHVVSVEADKAVLEFVSTVGTFAVFPYAFRLTATYTLEQRKLCAEFQVENLGGTSFCFQLGGHPAITLPNWSEENTLDGYLRLEGNPTHVLRAGEQGCLEPNTFPVPLNAEGLVPLTVETFSHEALIFDAHQVHAATVLTPSGNPVARVESSAPVWLFWSPQGVHSPFVCLEPWYGLCDHQAFCGDITERPYINTLEAHAVWTGGYGIEVYE